MNKEQQAIEQLTKELKSLGIEATITPCKFGENLKEKYKWKDFFDVVFKKGKYTVDHQIPRIDIMNPVRRKYVVKYALTQFE